MDDVVLGAVAPQMPGNGEPEAKRRQQRASLSPVHATGGREPEHAHAGEGRMLGRVPVPHGHVRHVVTGGGDVEGEVSHPPLRPSDRLREEMVVDQADSRLRMSARVFALGGPVVPPVPFEAGETPLEGQRNPLVPQPQLQARELGRLVDGRVGKPAPVPCAPEPRHLAERVAKAGFAQGDARRRRLAHVRTIGRHAGVEEAPKRARDRVGVRVADRGARLVHDLEAREQDSPRPLLVLAHDHVGGQRVALEHGRAALRS